MLIPDGVYLTENVRHTDVHTYRGSGCVEISAPWAFMAFEVSVPKKDTGASAAERGSPCESKTIDEDQR